MRIINTPILARCSGSSLQLRKVRNNPLHLHDIEAPIGAASSDNQLHPKCTCEGTWSKGRAGKRSWERGKEARKARITYVEACVEPVSKSTSYRQQRMGPKSCSRPLSTLFHVCNRQLEEPHYKPSRHPLLLRTNLLPSGPRHISFASSSSILSISTPSIFIRISSTNTYD